MSTPKFSDFRRWAGKLFNKADWEFNLQKIIDWFTDGSADISVGSMSVAGAFTATTLSGNGAGITGIAGVTSKEYIMNIKYPYVTPSAANVMSLQKGTVSKVEVKLATDGGVQLDSMDSASAWTANGACTTLAVNTYANRYLTGSGAVGWVKDATSTIAKMYKTFSSWNATGAKLRTDVFLPTITDVSAVRIWAHSSANTDYCYYDITSNVGGSSLAVGWNKVEVDFSDTPTATIGAFNVGAITRNDLGIVTGSDASTSAEIRWDNLIYQLNANDSHRLDFDVVIDDTTVVKPSASTNTINGLMAGVTTTVSNFSTISIDTNSIIGVNIYNVSSSYAGEGINIAVYTI